MLQPAGVQAQNGLPFPFNLLFCFSADQTVELPDGTKKRMDELKKNVCYSTLRKDSKLKKTAGLRTHDDSSRTRLPSCNILDAP